MEYVCLTLLTVIGCGSYMLWKLNKNYKNLYKLNEELNNENKKLERGKNYFLRWYDVDYKKEIYVNHKGNLKEAYFVGYKYVLKNDFERYINNPSIIFGVEVNSHTTQDISFNKEDMRTKLIELESKKFKDKLDSI